MALILLFIWGCKKNNPNYYYISYEANGVRHVDTSEVLAFMYANDTVHSYSALLIAHQSPLSDLIQIGILLKVPFNTTTVYVDTMLALGTPVSMGYYVSPFTYPAYPKLSSETIFPNKVKVHFTNISPGTVKGTFSGNMAASYNSPVTSITNGEFYLKVH